MNPYQKIRKINSILLKRYGKRILTFLHMFWGVILLLLTSFVFETANKVHPDFVKQSIAGLVLLFVFGDLATIMFSLQVETILSISVLKIYPLSVLRILKLTYYYFFAHSRVALYILPALYISFFYYGLLHSFIFYFVVGLIISYLLSTAIIAALFYLTELVKYKYGHKQLLWFAVPFLLMLVLGNDSTIIYNNIIVDYIYNMIGQLTS